MNVAIIGHGRSPEGTGWGQRIDACDAVIRMWDWEWQSAEDYGRKYDYGFYPADTIIIQRIKDETSTSPRLGWIGWNEYGKKHYDQALPNTHQCNDVAWTEIGDQLGGAGEPGYKFQLSRGAVAACWSAEFFPEGSTIILVGFDSVRQCRMLPPDEAYSQECANAYGEWRRVSYLEEYPAGRHPTKFRTHDFEVEGSVIAAVAAKRNVAVTHAQDVF
jgi:hypothetical protein